jgi:hypothetical protein
MKRLWLWLLPLVLLAQGRSFEVSSLDIPMLQTKHIFVISVISVTPSQWQPAPPVGAETRTLTLAVRLQKNLRGEISLPVGTTTQLTVKQLKYPAGMIWDNPEYWSYINVQPDQIYLVFSQNPERDLAVLLQRPDQTEEASQGTAVEDVEFILQNTKVLLAEQTRTLTAWLKDSTPGHGWHIGEYASALLFHLPAKDAAELHDFVESGHFDEKLTEDGRHAFLVASFQRIQSSQQQQRNDLMTMLAKETLRLLLGQQAAFPSKVQVDLVENYLPWLVGSSEARNLLKRNILTETQRSNAISELKTLEKNTRLSASSRQNLANLREILERKSL